MGINYIFDDKIIFYQKTYLEYVFNCFNKIYYKPVNLFINKKIANYL